jgi:hypothetical protein
MYSVRRDKEEITVHAGATGDVLYKGKGDEYIVYRASDDAKTLTVKQIRELADDELLLALATAVQIRKP